MRTSIFSEWDSPRVLHLWLSAVVLEELVAGSRKADQHVLRRLERDFERVRRIVVPNITDWTQTGLILSRLGHRYGYEQIKQARLTNDALIAMSAAPLGITILTVNKRDFARLAEFRDFQWRVWRADAELAERLIPRPYLPAC